MKRLQSRKPGKVTKVYGRVTKVYEVRNTCTVVEVTDHFELGHREEVVFHGIDQGSAHAVALALANYETDQWAGQWTEPTRTTYPVQSPRRRRAAA